MKLYYLDKPEEISDYRARELLENKKPIKSLTVPISRYGYRVVTVWAYSEVSIKGISVNVTPPVKLGTGVGLSHDACMAINYEGYGADGLYFNNKFNVLPRELLPIMLGLDFTGAEVGDYTSILTVGTVDVELIFKVDDTPVFNSEITGPKALGRIKWLNSRTPKDSMVAKGFEPVSIDGYTISFTGKKAVIGLDGLIESVDSYYSGSNMLTNTKQNSLFYKPMEFFVEGQKLKYSTPRIESLENVAGILSEGRNEKFSVTTTAVVNYEGRFDYTIKLRGIKGTIIPNVALRLYFSACKYNMGLGYEGGAFRPRKWRFNTNKNQDCMYIGDVNCGARVKLKATNYRIPMYGSAYMAQPLISPDDTWCNYDAGFVNVFRSDKGVVFSAETGRIILAEDKELVFKFEVSLTPFRPIRLSRSMNIRPYVPEFQADDILYGAEKRMCNYVNLTSGGDYNPYENEPYLFEKALKYIVSEAHNEDIGVNLQYSPNLISASCTDGRFLGMFNDDVLFKTASNKLLVAKRKFEGVDHDKEKFDTLVATKPAGRMENYFVEGVQYLTHDVGIDGIVLSDFGLLRDTADRVKRILDRKTGIPAILGAEVGNVFDRNSGYVSALNAGADVLPFIDKLYIKPSFDLSKGRDYILTEISGVPFGVSAEIKGIKNSLLALLYGMTVTYSEDPHEAWKEKSLYNLHRYLDSFGISDAVMYGFWDDANPLSADKASIAVTSYVNGDKLFAVLYNFSDKTVDFELGINPKKGFTSVHKKVFFPEIGGIQKKSKFDYDSYISLKGHGGVILQINK